MSSSDKGLFPLYYTGVRAEVPYVEILPPAFLRNYWRKHLSSLIFIWQYMEWKLLYTNFCPKASTRSLAFVFPAVRQPEVEMAPPMGMNRSVKDKGGY